MTCVKNTQAGGSCACRKLAPEDCDFLPQTGGVCNLDDMSRPLSGDRLEPPAAIPEEIPLLGIQVKIAPGGH